MHGQFVWYELTTPDVESALAFYPRFTGWGKQPFDKDYNMFTTGGAPVAGIFRLNEQMQQQGVPPNWMPYIEATDVDATASKAASLGGTVVVPPADIPEVGRFAVLKDPQGATFGLYKPNGPSGAWDGTNIIGRFSWHELMSTDYAKGFDFYRDLFGWKQTGDAMDMGGGNMYFMYGDGQKMYGGMYNRMPDMGNVPPHWLLYIHVKDVAKALATAAKAGAKVVRPQMDIPGGTIAVLADPAGAMFALHDMKPMAAAPAPAPAKKAATKKKAAKPATKKVAKAAAPAKATSKAIAAKKAPPKAKAKAKAKPKAKAKAKAKAKPKAKPKAKAKAKAKSRRR
jgi:predicted enzyme related to lactoylglutathione lyase